MKTKLFTAFLLLNGITNAQSWFQQTSNTTKNLWGVSFVNQNIGFVCGDTGTILKTIDGGANWVPQNSGTTYQLAGLQFIDANTGYSISWSDGGGILLKTVNGGTTWNDISLNISGAHTGGGWFFSADTVLLAFGDSTLSNSKILKTMNGGVSWDTVYSGVTGTGPGYEWLSFFHFPDRNNGYATVSGSKILKTTDGGDNWTLLNNIGGNLWMSGVYFFNKDTGFVGGGIFTGGGSIFKTTDGGNTWQTLSNVYGTSIMLFTSIDTGYAIGFNTTLKKIIKTTDAGTSWSDDYVAIKNINGITFPNTNVGYAVGDSGVIIKYGIMTAINNFDRHNTAIIYPNPFSTQTTLQTDNLFTNATLTIYNSFGQQVKQIKNISGQTIILHRDNLPSGLYFVRLTEENNPDGYRGIAADKPACRSGRLVITDKR